jgi:hypothetical protein
MKHFSFHKNVNLAPNYRRAGFTLRSRHVTGEATGFVEAILLWCKRRGAHNLG